MLRWVLLRKRKLGWRRIGWIAVGILVENSAASGFVDVMVVFRCGNETSSDDYILQCGSYNFFYKSEDDESDQQHTSSH